MQGLGTAMGEALEILAGPARPILDRWFEAISSRLPWQPMPSSGRGFTIDAGNRVRPVPPRDGGNQRQTRSMGYVQGGWED